MTEVDETPILHPQERVRVRRRRRKHRSWFRRQWENHRARSIIVGVALLLLIGVLLWLLFLNRQLNDVKRFPMELDGRPPAGSGTNILVLGADDPTWRYGDPPVEHGVLEMLESGTWEPGRYRSDAIMVLHINADHGGAQLVSIPRDSYVPIDSEYAGESGKSKINAAFSWGGPELLVGTIEELTDLRIDHVMVTDFTHFIELTDAMGGVDVFSDRPVELPSGKHPAGAVHLEGEDALAYVRARYQLPRGDFDRVQNHQNFLRAVLQKLRSGEVLVNPVKLTRTVMEFSDMVAVDESFTAAEMRSLAWRSRGLRPGNMRFVTAPNVGTGTVEGAGSIVKLDLPQVRELFGALRDDQFESWYADNFKGDELGAPGRDR